MIEVLEDNDILFQKFIKQDFNCEAWLIMATLTLANCVQRWTFLISLPEIKGTFCHREFGKERDVLSLIFENVKKLLLNLLVLKIHSFWEFRSEAEELRASIVGVLFGGWEEQPRAGLKKGTKEGSNPFIEGVAFQPHLQAQHAPERIPHGHCEAGCLGQTP